MVAWNHVGGKWRIQENGRFRKTCIDSSAARAGAAGRLLNASGRVGSTGDQDPQVLEGRYYRRVLRYRLLHPHRDP